MEMRPNRKFTSPDEIYEQAIRDGKIGRKNRAKTTLPDMPTFEEWCKLQDGKTKTRYPKKEAYRKRLAAQVEAIARHTLDDSLKSREAKLRTRRELLRKRKAK